MPIMTEAYRMTSHHASRLKMGARMYPTTVNCMMHLHGAHTSLNKFSLA